MNRTIRIMALVVMGIAITLATGELHTTGWGYGLPLPWKIDPTTDCPSPFSSGPCPLIISGSFVYNWFFFVLDVLFYTAIGYGLLLAFRKFKQPPTPSPEA